MRTPAGRECRYFYGDYHRGKSREECRLIGNVPPPNNWIAKMCRDCPVPGILLSNSCPNMVLSGKVVRFLGIFKRSVSITAYCSLAKKAVTEPEIGCGQCHLLPFTLADKAE